MEGRRIPSIILQLRVRDERIGGDNPFRWQATQSQTLFQGRRVVAFSLPGAFTPVCSNQQCPSFDDHYDEIRSLGVDEVLCLAVNDAFVMHQWAVHLGLVHVKMIPDGNGDFARRLGMLVDRRHLGMGFRSWRFAMVVADGVIEKWFEEPGINDEGLDEDPYGATSPETVIGYLRSAGRR